MAKEYTKSIEKNAFKLIEFYREHPIAAAFDLLNVELAPIQAKILNDMWFSSYVIVVAGRGCGKALRPDELVRVRFGWKPIKDIVVGDYVYGSDGKLAKVTMITGVQKNLKFFNITFSDGRCIKCCEDHQWSLIYDGEPVVKKLKDILDDYCNYRLPVNRAIVEDNTIEIHIKPSDLGAFLCGAKYIDREKLHIYELDDISEDKLFIPEDYLYNNLIIRQLLITSIIRHSTTDKQAVVSTIKCKSKQLIKDICNLARSVGYTCRVINDTTIKLSYVDSVSIDSIEYIGRRSGCCISVDNKDNTYITKDYIVTHNSFLQAVNACLTVLLFPGKRVGLIGSSFRQAKTMFNEVDRIYQMSPILQQACERKPVHGTDMCILKLKPAGRFTGTRIAAIPLGNDGGKIRGERFHVIAADEFAQIPESIFNLVIKPMAATASDPMERAKRVARAKELAKMGIEVEDDDVANKIVMSSSGYYKTNHMWDRMKYYWSRMRKKDSRYSVIQVPYWFMPEGFLDETNIEEAKETLPRALFEMEYCGMMVSDTDGFYKASLLESCTANSADNYYTVLKVGKADNEYIMAVDPARERDSFAILIFEVTGIKSKVVYAKTYDQVSSIKTAKAIFKLRDRFNLTRIIMDSQGGGSNIRDLLEEGIGNNRPIYNIDDKKNFGREGDMILELFKPSPKANTQANYTALSMLEHKRVWFPGPPQVSDDKLEDIYEECFKLKKQLVSIVTAPLGGGYLKFMTSAPKAKKDLYSCFIMGCDKINELYKEQFIVEDTEPILSFGGVINNRVGGDFYESYGERERPLIVPGV